MRLYTPLPFRLAGDSLRARMARRGRVVPTAVLDRFCRLAAQSLILRVPRARLDFVATLSCRALQACRTKAVQL